MKPALDSVHPQLQELAKRSPTLPVSARSLWWLRWLVKLFFRSMKTSAGVHVTDQFINGSDQKTKIRLRVYRSDTADATSPALVWMHGGGYVIGVPEMDNVYITPFVQEAGAVVISVDYRLAPEHPFPAPLEDCYAALQWIVANAETLGIDPHRIAIGGLSAGAGLAAGLAQLTKDRGAVQPIFQLLVYPMLDDRTATRTDLDPSGFFNWTNHHNYFGWMSYLKQAPGSANPPAYAVPARRANVSGLPPAWIGVGTLDLFHDEDVAYATRLKDVGVPCELVIVPSAFHGFDVLDETVPIVKAFRQSQVDALKTAFQRS